MPGIQHPTLGFLPSVTEVLSAVGLSADYSGIDPATLAHAAERGTALHAMCEAHHYGWLDRGAVLPEHKPYLDAYERFLIEADHTPIISEFELMSPTLLVCGHPDRVGWQGEERWGLDWKFQDSVDLKAATYQLAGYRYLWNEAHPDQPIHQTGVLQFTRAGKYRLHPVNAAAKENVFLWAAMISLEKRSA